MKQLLIITGIFFLFCNSANSAEHTIKPGDTIGKVALELGCSIEQLATLNNLDENYTIVLGEDLTYVNEREIKDARKYINLYAFSLRDDDPKRKLFLQMMLDIERNNIQYGNGFGIHVKEILVLAEAYNQI